MVNISLPFALPALSWADGAALSFLLLAWFAVGRLIEHPPKRNPSVSVLMQDYRRQWMRNVITREPRVFDSQIISNLRQGTAFFASTAMIALGGGLALIGNVDRLAGLAREFSLGQDSNLLWEIKLIVVLAFVTNAFLKFVWSHRVFGYCAVMLGAMPNEGNSPLAQRRAAQAATLNISAAKAFNRGMRSVYFALGTLAWLLGAVPLMLATCFTIAVLLRREFGSATRKALADPEHLG
ncbi:MAG: DUF599 domain-containing protein [Rhodobacteraceae bacterium]|nr:DUF599 domain-containing protein [Paracoccaceae bacterium]